MYVGLFCHVRRSLLAYEGFCVVAHCGLRKGMYNHTYKETYKGTYKGMYNHTYIETCKDLARHFFLKKKVSGQILSPCLYMCVVIHPLIRPLAQTTVCNNTKSLIRQERPTYMAKETYIHAKRDLFTWQKRPTYNKKKWNKIN